LQELIAFTFKSSLLRFFPDSLSVLKFPYSLQSSTGQMVIVYLEFYCCLALNSCSQDCLTQSRPSYFFSPSFCFATSCIEFCVLRKKDHLKTYRVVKLILFISFDAIAFMRHPRRDSGREKETFAREVDYSLSFQGIIINREKKKTLRIMRSILLLCF